MLGIACGGQNIVNGVKKGSGVEIILSITSKRAVPAMITYSDKQRFYGDQAQELHKSKMNSSINYLNRFLGLQSDWSNYSHEELYSLAKPEVDFTTNRICFNIDYKGETLKVYPEAAMGMLLNKMRQLYKGQCQDVESVSITVPDYYTVNQRVALMDACKIGNLKLIQLVNESSANAINYGLFRRGQMDDKAKIVGFIDFGHTKTSIFFGSFSKNLQKVISVTNEICLGVRDIDHILVTHFAAAFKKKYGSDPMKNKKCILRMTEVVTKARKILSGNSDTSVSIESWLDDEDFSCIFKRDEMEVIIQPILEKFKAVLIKALADSKLKLEEVTVFEMVGDGVRIPAIQRVIKETYGVEVSRTLAPDENASRGCTLFSALSSPFSSIKDYTFEHYNNHTIILEYPFLKDGQVQIRTHKIINKGDHFPSNKSIKFNEKQLPHEKVIQVKLYYSKDEATHLSNPLISVYDIHLPKISTEKFELVLHFHMDLNGIPFIEKSNLNEITYEEVPVEKKKGEENKGMEVEAETKTVKREKSFSCVLNVLEQTYGLNKNIVDNCIALEKKLEEDDNYLIQVHNKRNDVEQFIYNTRAKLDGDLINHITPDEKIVLEKEMAIVEEWFYSGDAEIEDMNVLSNKVNNLDQIGQIIYRRFNEWNNVIEAGKYLENNINQQRQRLNAEYEKFTKKDPNVYLTQADFEEINSIFDLYKTKLTETSKELEHASRKSDPPVLSTTISQYFDDMNKKVSNVYSAAENKVREQKRKEEKEKKEKEQKEKELREKEEKEKKEKEKADKQNTNPEDKKEEKKDDNNMMVD